MSKYNKSGNKGGDKRYRFVQTLVSPEEHKALKVEALNMDVTLAWLLRDIIRNFIIDTEDSHGRNTSKGRTKESQEAY